MDPLSSVRDSNVGRGTGSSPPILPTKGRLGIFGHQSPTTLPVSRLNDVPCAGQVTHPLDTSAWNMGVFPTRGNPKWLHLLLTARTWLPSKAKRMRWPLTSTTSFPFAAFTSASVPTFVHALACTKAARGFAWSYHFDECNPGHCLRIHAVWHLHAFISIFNRAVEQCEADTRWSINLKDNRDKKRNEAQQKKHFIKWWRLLWVRTNSRPEARAHERQHEKLEAKRIKQ